jgi:hypothetical protein
MYKYKNNISRLTMLSRYKMILNLLMYLLVFSFVLSISGYATTETARVSENSAKVSSVTRTTELNEAQKLTFEKSETNNVLPLLFLFFGFVIFVTFTFIFPVSDNIKILDRLK